MATESFETKGPINGAAVVDFAAYSNAHRAGLINVVAAVLGVGLAMNFASLGVASLAFGYLVGAVNGFWLLRIARKGLQMAPAKSSGFVIRRYYVRFLATALVLGVVLTREVFSPFPLVVGLIIAVFASLGVMVFAVKEEMD